MNLSLDHLRSLPDGSLTQREVEILCNEIDRLVERSLSPEVLAEGRRLHADTMKLVGMDSDTIAALTPEEAKELSRKWAASLGPWNRWLNEHIGTILGETKT